MLTPIEPTTAKIMKTEPDFITQAKSLHTALMQFTVQDFDQSSDGPAGFESHVVSISISMREQREVNNLKFIDHPLFLSTNLMYPLELVKVLVLVF